MQKKTSSIFFNQLSRNPASDLGAAENFIMDPVEAEQNQRRYLRNIRERKKTREREQARRLTRNIDRGSSKRAPNRWNNGDKPETTVLDRGDSKRVLNRWNNRD